SLRRKQLVELGGAEEPRQVRPPKLAETGKRGPLELSAHQRPVELLGLVEKPPRLLAQPPEVDPPELRVGIRIARPAELRADPVGPLEHPPIDGVETLL